MTSSLNSFNARRPLEAGLHFFSLADLGRTLQRDLSRLPFSIRVLLENLLRLEDGRLVTADDVRALAAWTPDRLPEKEIPFIPARVLLQDFTGVPVVVDMAALRDAARAFGRDPKRINPLFPVDLVIDHSVQVDAFGSTDAFAKNAALEYERNQERYAFLKWGQKALRNFRAVPPEMGIVHQVNLEHLADVVRVDRSGDVPLALFDSVIGTDSHTTMINGPLAYLRLTGRSDELVRRVETYAKAQGVFRGEAPEPRYSDLLEVDLSGIVPTIAGPKRPQDRVALSDAKASFLKSLTAPVQERGFEIPADTVTRKAAVPGDGFIGHGAVVLAAITSCTNTSNPSVLVAAGLLAKKAVEKGLAVAPTVKTSLAPGSRVVTDYLNAAGLTPYLEKLNFHLVGYGCTTCIGNSGPLPDPVVKAIKEGSLVAAAVLSGNRNFEGRVNPHVKANYLASPPLVVAYALAGRMDIDLTSEPLGTDRRENPVYLKEIWPSEEEIHETVRTVVRPDMFRARYATVNQGDAAWNALPVAAGDLYAWDERSTYIKKPPYFDGMSRTPPGLAEIRNARALAVFGDSITTDHISPAGSIAEDSPAGRHLIALGVPKKEFNSYGARRGNHEIMARGTFANIRLTNLMVPGVEGGVTVHLPSNERLAIFDAAARYEKDKVPLIVIAGKEYGSGSSRDWAAKGPRLLGVRAVIAESYERIHRSNLVGMGLLPLQFLPGETRDTLGLTGRETFDIEGLTAGLTPKKKITVNIRREDGTVRSFDTIARADTPVEIDYLAHGGVLPAVLRQIIARE